MRGFPLLSLLLLLPFFGACFLIFVTSEMRGLNAKRVALWCTGGAFLVSCIIALLFDPRKGLQFLEYRILYEKLNIAYAVGVDGLSLPFVLLTTFLTPLCCLVGWRDPLPHARLYMGCFLLLETFLLGAFLSLNLFVFYIFFEGTLIPLFFLIGIWGGTDRFGATLQFFFYMAAGSLVLMAGLIVLFEVNGAFDLPLLLQKSRSLPVEKLLWVLLFGSFAIKLPLWPFHTWLPRAHGEAPTAVSMILAGVVLKLAGYGFLRYLLPLFPQASALYAPIVFSLSGIGIIILSLVAWAQKDMKRLLAYSSVAHMAIVNFGIFTGTGLGMKGAVFQMISHGLTSAALFLLVGYLYRQYETYHVHRYAGLFQAMPLWSCMFWGAGFAALGVPFTSGFVGEFLVIWDLLGSHPFWAIMAISGLLLGVVYMGTLWARILFGRSKNGEFDGGDNNLGVEYGGVCWVLLSVILFLGLYPSFLLDMIASPIDSLENLLQAVPRS